MNEMQARMRTATACVTSAPYVFGLDGMEVKSRGKCRSISIYTIGYLKQILPLTIPIWLFEVGSFLFLKKEKNFNLFRGGGGI